MRNLIPQFIAEKFLANQSSGNFAASTMFLDISGFTPMTERLMKEGKEGAEVLSEIINNIFSPVISEVYHHGGFIASFAGDAFTAIFKECDNHLQIAACALEINRIFQKIGKQSTKFGEFELFVKLGLSHGLIEWGIVGKDNHKSFYFKGEAIDRCAECEHNCQKMEIVLDNKLLELLPFELVVTLKIDNNYYKLIGLKGQIIQPLLKNSSDISQEILQKFIPDQVLTLDQQGEFREIVAVFISFKEPDRIEDLNHLILKTINRCDQYGGYFNQALFGDKGGMMLICFGMPKSYENNLVRALDFSLDLAKEFGDRIRVGLNSGIAYSGFIGSSIICEYTAFGDIVNQAARFMAKADWSKIWTTEKVAGRIAKLYNFNNLGEMQFKGKSEQIAIFELTGKTENNDTAFFSGEMVARKAELELLNNFAKPLAENKFAGIITVYAEAGMGKSRLVYEFVKSQVNAEILFLQTDSVLRMSLNPFKYLLHNYFGQNKAATKEEKRANFEAVFELLLAILDDLSDDRKLPIIKELERTKSILAAQVEVFYDNSLYEQLDAKGRFENTLFAYKEFFKALSLFKPVIVQIEDIHWLDDDSQAVLKTLCRAVDDFPIMIVTTSRFNDDGSKPGLKVDKEVNLSEIILDKLDAESGKYFMELQLEKPADDDLIGFVCNKAEYNPFYIEQIIYYLKENNLLAEKEGKSFLIKQDFTIPNSISAIIIARIDRLEYDVKNLLQMASVFGREVELKTFLIMIELYQLKVEQSQLKSMLEKIEDEQLWNKFAEIKYIFKHALLNEAAYEMQLKSRLRDLHKLAAQSLEKLYLNEEEKFYEIARHYDKAEEIDLAVNYYEKAGDWLKKNYQNAKAIECYDRVLAFLDEEKDAEKVIDVLNNCGEVLKLIGKWNMAENIFLKSFNLANSINDKGRIINSGNELALLKSNKGDKNTALLLFEQSLVLSEELGDVESKAIVFGNIGSIYNILGNYGKSMEFYNKRLLIAEQFNDKRGISFAHSNIGSIYLAQGDLIKSMDYYQKSLHIDEEICDKQNMSIAIVNIGAIYYNQGETTKAMNYFQKYLQISEELGDKRGVLVALANIGCVYEDQGKYAKAMEHLQKGLLIAEELGDKQRISVIVGNIGNVYYGQGDSHKAMECYLKKLKIAEDIGDKLSASISISSIATIYKDQKIYIEAMTYIDKAICLGKELNTKYYLSRFLYSKAELLYFMEDIKNAKEINAEAMNIAKEINREDIIFSSTILSHKLTALENPTEAVTNLVQMLESETEEENLATIHYEIYKINQSATHQQKALDLFQQLYEKTPNIEYKNRIDELKTAE